MMGPYCCTVVMNTRYRWFHRILRVSWHCRDYSIISHFKMWKWTERQILWPRKVWPRIQMWAGLRHEPGQQWKFLTSISRKFAGHKGTDQMFHNWYRDVPCPPDTFARPPCAQPRKCPAGLESQCESEADHCEDPRTALACSWTPFPACSLFSARRF